MDEIIEAVAPPRSSITLTFGRKDLTFEAIRDRVRLREIQRAAARFSEIKPEKVPIAADREYYDTDEETLRMAYVLAECSLSPKFTPLDFLKLAKLAAVPFEQLVTQVNLGHTAAAARAEHDQIEDTKKDSSETSDSETA